MLALLRQAENQKNKISSEFCQDLNWFTKFVPKFNGTAFFIHNYVNQEIELDACLQGMGAIWNNQVYATILSAHYTIFQSGSKAIFIKLK